MLFSLLKRSPVLVAGGRSLSLLSKPNPALHLGVARPSTSFYAQAASRRAFLTTTPALAAAKDNSAAAAKPKAARTTKAKAAAGEKKEPAAAGTKKKTTTTKAATKKAKPKKKVALKKRAVKKKAVKPKPKRITKKDTTPPFKRPSTSWMAFVKQFAEGKGEGVHFVEMHRQAATEWRSMTEAEKRSYSPPRDEIEAYKVKRIEWLKSLEPKLRRVYRARHKAPSRRGRTSAYALYTQDQWNLLPAEMPFGEKAKTVALMYRELSFAQKEDIRERAKKITEEKAAAAAAASTPDSDSSSAVASA